MESTHDQQQQRLYACCRKKYFFTSGDLAREILKNEMVRKKNLFLKALQENDVSILPILPEYIKKVNVHIVHFMIDI